MVSPLEHCLVGEHLLTKLFSFLEMYAENQFRLASNMLILWECIYLVPCLMTYISSLRAAGFYISHFLILDIDAS